MEIQLSGENRGNLKEVSIRNAERIILSQGHILI